MRASMEERPIFQSQEENLKFMEGDSQSFDQKTSLASRHIWMPPKTQLCSSVAWKFLEEEDARSQASNGGSRMEESAASLEQA